MKLLDFKDKRILILGFGREGIDTFKFLRKMFPEKVLGIGDSLEISNFPGPSKARNSPEGCFPISNLLKKDKKIRLHLGPNYLKAIKNYDVIIKSPGIPIHLPEVERAYKQGKITSQTEIFLKNFKGKVIGITGTKGKGTTASLIYEILKEGLKVHPVKFASQTLNRVNLGGNIEKPVLTYLLESNLNDIFVYEMSSHQLYSGRSPIYRAPARYNIGPSPHIAVLVNISPAHLDYYKNFKEYINTKANITKYQKNTDFLIYNSEDKIAREIAKKSKAKKIPVSQKETIRLFKKCKKSRRNDINFVNIAAAVAVGNIFGIPQKKIVKAIEKFKGLPHRLEFIGTHLGILFYDDSAATVPEATFHALKTLGNRVQTIILGGYESNVSFKDLAKNILNNEIKSLILFPPAGERIWKALRLAEFIPHRTRSGAGLAQGKKLPRHFFVNNMKDAVKLAYQHTQRGKICLLSCAVPSFGIFKDYKHRGNLFKKYVKLFGKPR